MAIPTDNQQRRYDLQEGAGGTITDQSANDVSGTVVSEAFLTNDIGDGVYAGVDCTDNNRPHILIGDVTVANTMTWCWRIRPTALNDGEWFLDQYGSSPQRSWKIGSMADGRVRIIVSSDGTANETETPGPAGEPAPR